MRPCLGGGLAHGSVTSMVSEASRASSAADFRTSRRAASAWVTLSLARLIAAPCVLRSSGDILPSVASSAEIEPFLPSAATRTVSSAASSPAAAIWSRMVFSSVARSDTVKSLLSKGGWLSPLTGRNVKQKAGSGSDRALNPSARAGPSEFERNVMRSKSFCDPGVRLDPDAVRLREVPGQVDGWTTSSRRSTRPELRPRDESVRGLRIGASGDVHWRGGREEVRGDFLGRPMRREAGLQARAGVCDRKYRNQSGTMYISFTAFCRAEVAQRYSKQALRAAR